MLMPGRGYSASGAYRYGFNGQEKSTEIDPNGNSLTAEFWQYDARLGRRWNVDPKPNTSFSPYLVLANNPIYSFDPLGDTSRPAQIKVGTIDYYQKRAQDFFRRHPDKNPPSYYLAYGDVYVKRFSSVTKQNLSEAGKKWLDEALYNLQTAIEKKLVSKRKEDQNIELDDEKFTDFAFDSHVEAYEDAGVLSLPIMD
jgi:hypothetical protein